MYDFIDFTQGTNFYLNLYCFLLYCCLVVLSLKGNMVDIYAPMRDKTRTTLLFGGVVLFAMTSFVDSDFFHYNEFMTEFNNLFIDEEDVRVEIFYQYLISFINGNYALFRLVVWGGAALIAVWVARVYRANSYNMLFVILAGYIVIFSYARATLAVAVLTLGVAMLCTASDKKRMLKSIQIIAGLAIAMCSIYFHRSILPVLAVTVGWCLLPRKRLFAKGAIWFFVVLVILCAIVIKWGFEELTTIANAWQDDESGTLDKIEHYRSMKGESSNINGYISLVIKYSTFYIPFFVIAHALRKPNIMEKVDGRTVKLYLFVVMMLAFATSFLFIGSDSDVLYYRYLYMSFIPLALLISYMKEARTLPERHYKLIIVCLILNTSWQLLAAVYSQIE